ncbi:MAG: T9SS type A sorting domain-containing protein [Paludibacter sp.]|nr:T9SS type A sorting domain-containing protein [Paludibacter sp.]
MNKTSTLFISTILIFVIISSSSILIAQKKTSLSPQVSSNNFSLTVQNMTQTAPNKLEFDVYLLNTLPAGTAFQLAQIQLGFLINASIHEGGTLSLSVSNVGSGLTSAQQFNSSGTGVTTMLEIYPYKTLLQQSGRNLPGAGFGTIISAVSPGTKLAHYILTNSVNFVSNTVPDLLFISTNNPDPYQELFLSGISYYANNIVTNLTVNSGVNAIVNGNPVLNPAPTAYDVTGTASTCSGLGGLPVGLAGSESGVTYTLYKNAVAQTPTVAGTGSAITFGNQLEGTYSVQGTLNSISTEMTGNAVITETPSVAAGVNISADNNPVNTGTSVTFTATPTGGGTTPSYQWYNGAVKVGTDSSVYSYTPTNGDVISVIMTSNAPCVTGSPATSNLVSMTITQATSIDQNKMTMDIYSKDKNIIVNCTQNTKQVLIYNSLGSLLEKENNIHGLKTFNMDKSPNGYYFVKLITDYEVFTQKVLLK